MTIPVSVDLQIVAAAADLPDEAEFGRWVAAALQAAGEKSAAGYDLAVRLVDEDESQALNKRFTSSTLSDSNDIANWLERFSKK